jgi:hypothetical protein
VGAASHGAAICTKAVGWFDGHHGQKNTGDLPMTQARIDGLVAKLEKGQQKTLGFFNALLPEQWKLTIYTEPHWQVYQLLAHFVSAEKQLLVLVQDIVDGGRGSPIGFEIDKFNADEQKRLEAQSVQNLLDELERSRRETIEWVRRLGPNELDKIGYHPALGKVNVETMIAAIHGHHLMHIRDLSRLLKADTN